VVAGLANCVRHTSSYYPLFEILRQTLYLVVPAMGDTIAAGLLANAFISDDLPTNAVTATQTEEHRVVNLQRPSRGDVHTPHQSILQRRRGFRINALQLTCIRRSHQRDVHTFAHYLAPAPVLQVHLQLVAKPLYLRFSISTRQCTSITHHKAPKAMTGHSAQWLFLACALCQMSIHDLAIQRGLNRRLP
jgi:hypothetical protein